MKKENPPLLIRRWSILWVLFVFLMGCESLFSIQTPSLEPGITTTDAPQRTTPAKVEFPDEILEACRLDEQKRAMRAKSVPDWESLGLRVCYDLQLELQQANPQYTGSGRIVLKNRTGEELADLVLRTYPNAREIYGGQLQVTAARLNGVQVEPEIFLDDRTAVRIPLTEPLPVDGLAVLEIEFNGQTAQNFNTQANVYGVFNYDSSEQVLTLANWYPLVAPWGKGSWRVEPVVGIGDAVVSEAALYRVKVSAPEAWQVVTTGVKLGEERRAEIKLHQFASGLVRDFTVVASPRFEMEKTEVRGITFRQWGLPGGEASWTAVQEVSLGALALFDERFGSYPYAELDTVAVPLNLASGVEYPGLILIDHDLYTSGSTRPGFFDVVISHEVAHQWWYAVVGNDVIENPWQDEALTTFSSLLYQQEYLPDDYRRTLNLYQEREAELERSLTESEVGQPVEAFLDDPWAYSPVVYIKGALFFVELRQEIGDKAFFAALRAYYADHVYNLAEPQALLQAFETACNCQLDDTYQEWGVD